MAGRRRILIALAILVAGVCAAVPFHRHFQEEQAADNSSGSQTSWQSGKSEHIPLQVRVHTGESPASGLYDEHNPSETTAPAASVVTTAPRIDAIDLPPKLPVAFPVDVSSPSGRPGAAETTVRPSTRTIRHKIKDDDTLRTLAARFLGNENRYMEIFNANPQLASPTLLPIGEEIMIPVDTSPTN